MRVEISNLQPINSGKDPSVYTASKASECRDATDIMAYLLCVEHGKTIVLGKTIATPHIATPHKGQ